MASLNRFYNTVSFCQRVDGQKKCEKKKIRKSIAGKSHNFLFLFLFFYWPELSFLFLFFFIFVFFFPGAKACMEKMSKAADLVWTAAHTLLRPRSYLAALPFHCINT